ncbi:oxaloacetate decarboxylase [Primorskyibacter flagellatus]|uniref:Oxaloacetate decarboxylase n=2 Tax=Primorskyibacter flagellatus TaxID=1387277 RepID=A0A917EJ97_9RHOB|nr:oxaloacetate decarboxylase [Primorskyibacter flagellatus]
MLSAGDCIRPASVYDALTARMAAELGFPAGMLGGSVAALAVLGSPDHGLLTLDEFAGLCRRICRTGALPLMVDADHGYGNALNAMRCVEELETAGVAALTLEDTALPLAYGQNGAKLIGLAEARDKLSAALEARQDPGLVIIARTDARYQDAADLTARARAFADAGADAIFLTGARTVDQLTAVREASGLPLMLAAQKGDLAGVDVAALGVRLCLTPHDTLPAALRGAYRSLAAVASADGTEAPEDLMRRLNETERYDDLMRRFLKK